MGYKKHQWELGPNPDPFRFKDVRTKDGWYRKCINYGSLNSVMTEYKDATKLAMPAARRLMGKIEPWTRGLELGRIQATIGGRLKSSYMQSGKMTFEYLNELQMQPRRKMSDLIRPKCQAFVMKDEVVVKQTLSQSGGTLLSKPGERPVWADGATTVIKLERSIYTEFYFELIMVWGNPMKENGLKVDSVESKLYSRYEKYEESCELRIDIPKKGPWVLFFKVSCLEDGEMAKSSRHYGMKVVAVG